MVKLIFKVEVHDKQIKCSEIVKKFILHFYSYNHRFRTLDTNVTHSNLNIGTYFKERLSCQFAE